MKYLILFLSFFAFAFLNKHPKFKFGVYELKHSFYYYEELQLFQDSTFLAHSSGCTFSYDGKGKWFLKNDTLVATALVSRNARYDSVYKPCKPETFYYLLKRQTFICLAKDSMNVFYKSHKLEWVDPSAPPKKLQKF